MKHLYLILFAVLLAFPAYAATTDDDGQSNRDAHWFIGAQGGLNVPFSENTRFAESGMVSGGGALTVGKFFSKDWGSRIQLYYGGQKGQANMEGRDWSKGAYSFNEFNAYIDALWRASRMWDAAHESKFAVNIFAGIGVATASGYESDDDISFYPMEDNAACFSFHGGLIGTYHATDALDINLELSSGWMGDKFNGVDAGRALDGNFRAQLGLSYSF